MRPLRHLLARPLKLPKRLRGKVSGNAFGIPIRHRLVLLLCICICTSSGVSVRILVIKVPLRSSRNTVPRVRVNHFNPRQMWLLLLVFLSLSRDAGIQAALAVVVEDGEEEAQKALVGRFEGFPEALGQGWEVRVGYGADLEAGGHFVYGLILGLC